MAKIQWDALNGKQRDGLVAEKIMGWRRYLNADTKQIVLLHEGRPRGPNWFPISDTEPVDWRELYRNVVPYAANREAASEVEAKVCGIKGRGNMLEAYLRNLLNVVCGATDVDQTTMGEHNWFRFAIQSHYLYALVRAVPDQRCIAALLTVGVDLEYTRYEVAW